MPDVLPEIRALLAAQAGAEAPAPGLALPELRATCDAGIVALHRYVRDLGTPGETRDLRIPVTGGSIPARLYLPTADGRADLPVHVHLHGGGWWMGSIETADPMARELCVGSGMGVLSVGYRLAPDHPWPTASEDAYAAVVWLTQTDELGFTPASVSIGGESAGANLAAAVTLMCRDRGGPVLVAQWLDVPAVDLTLPHTQSQESFASGFGLEIGQMDLIRPWYVDDVHVAHPYVSPAKATDLTMLPPALVTTAEFDPLRDQGEAYARALATAGVDVTLRRADGHIHGSTWLTGLSPSTADWHDAVVADLVGRHRAIAPAR